LCEYGKKPLKKKTENGGEKTKMNAKYKKSLKIVTLLISSIIIATVAADSYSELFMYGSDITIGTASVAFTAGGNTTLLSSVGVSTGGAEITLDQIPAIEPGETVTYEEAVNITNSAGASKTITMDVDTNLMTGDFDTNFDYVNITMIAADGSPQGTSIQIVSTGSNVTSTGGQTMADAEVWAVKWIIAAKSDATPTEAFSITFKVTVA
jgi:hypothetical protein